LVSNFVKFIKNNYKFVFDPIFYEQLDLVYIWW